MRNSILKMAGSSQRLSYLLPQTAYSATICEQTGCGKTVLILDLLEGPYRGSCARPFGIIRPISSVPGSGRTPRFTLLTPASDSTITCERSTMYLWGNRRCISPDDCSASTALTKNKDILSMLAFSGRHAEQSVWVLTQKYKSALKDLREQTRWVCLFLQRPRFLRILSA